MKDIIGSGIVTDINNKEYKIYPYRFLASIVSVTIMPEIVPIGCVAKDLDTGGLFHWIDNDFNHDDIIDKISDFVEDNDKCDSKIIDNYDYEYDIKLDKFDAEYMTIVRLPGKYAIMSLCITPWGAIKCFWIDKDFRGSKSLRKHIAILFSKTLSNGFIGSRVDKLFTEVYNGNVAAMKSQALFGFLDYGQLEVGGVMYNYSGQKVAECIDNVNKLVSSMG